MALLDHSWKKASMGKIIPCWPFFSAGDFVADILVSVVSRNTSVVACAVSKCPHCRANVSTSSFLRKVRRILDGHFDKLHPACEHFMTINRNIFGRNDSEPNAVPENLKNNDTNVVVDNNFFADFARQDEHLMPSMTSGGKSS
jgi:hypothetical protein